MTTTLLTATAVRPGTETGPVRAGARAATGGGADFATALDAADRAGVPGRAADRTDRTTSVRRDLDRGHDRSDATDATGARVPVSGPSADEPRRSDAPVSDPTAADAAGRADGTGAPDAASPPTGTTADPGGSGSTADAAALPTPAVATSAAATAAVLSAAGAATGPVAAPLPTADTATAEPAAATHGATTTGTTTTGTTSGATTSATAGPAAAGLATTGPTTSGAAGDPASGGPAGGDATGSGAGAGASASSGTGSSDLVARPGTPATTSTTPDAPHAAGDASGGRTEAGPTTISAATSTAGSTVGSIATASAVGATTPAPTGGAAAGPAAAPTGSSAPAGPAPLADQLGARLATLGGLQRGTHVLTVPVDPEHLGPVRIVAHIGAESVRVELLGATEASRQALQQSLADLRRDLAAAGLQVDVGDRRGASGTSADGTRDGSSDTRPGTHAPDETGAGRPEPTDRAGLPLTTPSPGRTGRLDLVV